MKSPKTIIFYLLLISCSVALSSCGKKADESRPLSEVRAEADKMNVEKLRSMAIKYKNTIMAKEGDVRKLAEKLTDIPITEKLGGEAKELTAEIAALNKSVSALKERFQIYYDKLKEKGGSLTGLEF